MIRKVIQFLMPIIVLAIGVVILRGLIATKPEAKKTERDNRGTLVEVSKVETGTQKIAVEAYGSVQPAQQVVLSPEVTGRITWIHKGVIPGGRLAKGTRLLKLNAYDYVLAAQAQKASLDRARTSLEIEKGRKKIAEKEWKLMGGKKPEGKSGALALREPQMRTALADLKAARSSLNRARLNIGRTQLKAPFNAMITDKQVDIGQLVGPSSRLVTLVGTDAYWVLVAVPISKLKWMSIPGVGGVGPGQGSMAIVRQEIGDQKVERTGKVIRLLGDLDPVGKMARVLVQIDDPLGLKTNAKRSKGKRSRKTVVSEGPKTPAKQLPLLLGSFVKVSIGGRSIDNVVRIPRDALHNGDEVYVYRDKKLDIRKVKVVWRTEESVILSEGLRSGDLVIVSPLPAPVAGMKLRTGDEPTTTGPNVDADSAAASPKKEADPAAPAKKAANNSTAPKAVKAAKVKSND